MKRNIRIRLAWCDPMAAANPQGVSEALCKKLL
jgi:hypothetical protein